MAGTIVADTLQSSITGTPVQFNDGVGTQIGTLCRAWVNFNGTTNTGGFCTIRASFNVTSVADNGVGIYTVNFTNALPDANYGSSIACSNSSLSATLGTYATGSVQARTGYQSGIGGVTLTDDATVCVAIFR